MSLDDLVRDRSLAVPHRDDFSWDAAGLWSAGRRRRQRVRLACAASGAALTVLVAGGALLATGRGSTRGSGPASVSPTFATPTPTHGSDLDDAVASFRDGTRVWIAGNAEGVGVVDSARTATAIGNAAVYVAVLPGSTLTNGETVSDLAAAIAGGLGRAGATVIVIAGRQIGATGGTGRASDSAESVVENMQQAHAGPFTKANVQGALDDAIAVFRGGPSGEEVAGVARTLSRLDGTAEQFLFSQNIYARDGQLVAALGRHGGDDVLCFWHDHAFLGSWPHVVLHGIAGLTPTAGGIAVRFTVAGAPAVDVTFRWDGTKVLADRAIPDRDLTTEQLTH